MSQSVKELEWKQAEMARTIVALMLKDEGWDAMSMLDWRRAASTRLAGVKVRILPT